jgi:hypothetical protein
MIVNWPLSYRSGKENIKETTVEINNFLVGCAWFFVS